MPAEAKGGTERSEGANGNSEVVGYKTKRSSLKTIKVSLKLRRTQGSADRNID